MRITDFLEGIGNPVQFYPDLVPITGSHNAATFLCQLCYWTGKERKPDGWIYKTQEEWQIETELSPKEQRTARELLKKRGLIEDNFVGIPRRLEYRLCKEALNKAWEMWLPAMRIKERLINKLREEATLIKHGVCDSGLKGLIDKLRSCLAIARSNPEMAESLEKSISDPPALTERTSQHSKQEPVSTASKNQSAQQAATNEDSYLYTEITSETTSEITPEKEEATTTAPLSKKQRCEQSVILNPELLTSQPNEQHQVEIEDFCDRNNSALPDADLLKNIEVIAFDWRKQPWMKDAYNFQPEIIQAVWQCNTAWYSLSNSQVPNIKKIRDRLRNLNAQLRQLNETAIGAYIELQNYWTTAKAIANPSVDAAFTHISARAKQASLQNQVQIYAQATADALQDL